MLEAKSLSIYYTKLEVGFINGGIDANLVAIYLAK